MIEVQQRINPRAIAALFKQEVADMFDAREAKKPLRTGAPHASSVLKPESEFCLRQLVLLCISPDKAVKPEQKPWDSRKNAIFANGWSLHEKYQKLMVEHGTVVVNENGKYETDLKHYNGAYNVYFSPDVIYILGSLILPIEIKGYKQEEFNKLDEFGAPPTLAHHQVNLYCSLLGMRYGLVLVENKNNQDTKVWCVEYDPKLAAPYLERLLLIKQYNDEYSTRFPPKFPPRIPLPERKCNSAGDRCAASCPIRDYCFSQK